MSLWIRDHVRAGMVVVDVGANYGSITSQLQQAGAEVWAIEPDPRCHLPLRTLVDEAHLIHVALGDRLGTVDLHLSRDPAQNSLYPPNVLEPRESLTVPLTTLDLLQEIGQLPPRIDAIKVDAQGAEAAILRGAARICQTQRPIWYVEFWPQGLEAAGSSAQALCDAYAAAGYVPEGQSWDEVVQRLGHLHGHGSHDILMTAA